MYEDNYKTCNKYATGLMVSMLSILYASDLDFSAKLKYFSRLGTYSGYIEI